MDLSKLRKKTIDEPGMLSSLPVTVNACGEIPLGTMSRKDAIQEAIDQKERDYFNKFLDSVIKKMDEEAKDGVKVVCVKSRAKTLIGN
jgi:predicted secreted protein